MTAHNATAGRESPVMPASNIAHIMEFAHACFGVSNRTLFPILDLLMRLWLAQTFWVSGVIKIMDWEKALFLAEYEYPVSWLAPQTAAIIGVGIEILGPIFFLLGLATRFAALPMLILSVVVQIEYLAIPVHEFWAILFGWYVVRGAGPISLDGLLRRGLNATALPLVQTVNAAYRALDRLAAPLYLVLIRIWIAEIFFSSGLTKIRNFDNTILLFEFEYQTPLLSPALAAYLATLFELVCPVLLVAGLATRLATIPLILMTAVIQLTYLQHIDHLYWLLLLGIMLLHGPGQLSLDHLLMQWLRRLYPQLVGMPAFSLEGLPHVVVVGAGFGGLSVAKALRSVACRVTIIDRHNYHLFQPLLYQVATAMLSPADIATPVRGLFRDQFNARVLLGRVTDVDTEAQAIVLRERRIGYDYLVLATGTRHSYFGRDAEWEGQAPGLKKIEDAEHVRRRLLVAFEEAETSDDPEVQRALLNFVIVGAGPTGVELAGAIAELARHGMEREFRHINPADARVMLVQSGPRVLPAFPERLSEISQRALEDLGVEVMLNSRVGEIDERGVLIGDKRIEARTVFWAAGVIASPAAKWVGAEHDRAGRVVVGPDLSVPNLPNVFAIGDTALSTAWKGAAVPGLAPAAKQGGQYVAALIRARILGRRAPGPFRYQHLGSLATIGRKAAVASFGLFTLSGVLAWWFWGFIHVYFLVGMRNRISVALEWFWAYLTFKRGTRLITNHEG